MNHKIAQRRNLFNKLFQTFDLGQHFNTNLALEQVRKIDSKAREIALSHGVKGMSLTKDLRQAHEHLRGKQLSILEAFRAINNFKIAIAEIADTFKKLELVLHMYPAKAKVKFASYQEKDREFEEMYRPMLEGMGLNASEGSPLMRLYEAAVYFNQFISKMFEVMDDAITYKDLDAYMLQAQEYMIRQRNFNNLYQQFYDNYIVKMLELKAKKHRGIGDVIETSREMSEKLLDRKFDACPCGSGRAYIACHGFSDKKVKDIMQRENLPYDRAEKRHYDMANFLAGGEAYRKALKDKKDDEGKE